MKRNEIRNEEKEYHIIEFVDDPESDGMLVREYSLQAKNEKEAIAVVQENFDALDSEKRMSMEEAKRYMEELERQEYTWDEDGIFLKKKGLRDKMMSKEEINISEEDLKEVMITGNLIIGIIDILDEEYKKLQEQDNQREKEVLGITLSECNTEEEINEYEKRLEAMKEQIDNDAIFREINEKQHLINKIKWKLYEMLKILLSNIYSEYKEISTYWIFLKYNDIRRIFKKAIGEGEI